MKPYAPDFEWSTRDDAAAAQFERGLAASFRSAASGRTIARSIRFGARRVALQFASEALFARLSRALARLEVDADTAPDLTVFSWDGESNAVALPRPPWRPEEIGPRGDIRALGSPRFRAAVNLDSGTLCFTNAQARRSYFWSAASERLPDYERAAPLRTLFAWGVEPWGFRLVHAGCVANQGRAVLLVGRGGSGKSTCALACLEAGLEYVADDYCVLSLESQRPEAYGLYATGKLAPEHLDAHFPELRPRALRDLGPKATLLVDGKALRRSSEPVLIEALVVPEVSNDGTTKLVCSTAASALSALAPSSIFQIPGQSRTTLRFLADVARRLPCYRLTLGSDLSVVRRVLSELVG